MRKSSSEKKSGKKSIEPPRRSTMKEVLERMDARRYFARECPHYKHGLNGDWDDSYSCSINRVVDESSGEWFCGECDFKGENYKTCLRYVTEQGRIARREKGEGRQQ